MVPDSQVAGYAVRAEVRLRLLHLRQALRRDPDAVRHPARETRSRGRVRYGHSQLARRTPYVCFCKSGFSERRADARRAARGVPGTMLAEIVGVGAVTHDREAPGTRLGDEPAP